MKERFYLDTSVWLDFFEDRNEPNMLKSDWARKLVAKIIFDEDIIIFTDNNMEELNQIGYSEYEVEELLNKLRKRVMFVEATNRQIGIARDLSSKRGVPRRDALHALI